MFFDVKCLVLWLLGAVAAWISSNAARGNFVCFSRTLETLVDLARRQAASQWCFLTCLSHGLCYNTWQALGPDDGMSMKKLRVDQGDAFGRDFKTPAWKAWIKDTAVQIMDLLEELAAAGAEGSPIASDDGGGFATPPPADAEDVGWDTPGHSSSGEGSGNLAPARHDPVPIRTTSLPDGNGSEAESFAPDTTSDDTEGDDDLSHGSLYVGDKVMADFRGEGQWYGGEIDAVDEAVSPFSSRYGLPHAVFASDETRFLMLLVCVCSLNQGRYIQYLL